MNEKQRAEKLAQEIRDNVEKANDFQDLMDHLPPGQIKNLLKDEYCGPILEKYGVTGS